MDLSNAYILGGKITDDNVTFYTEFGFLIAMDVLSKEEISALRKETTEIFTGVRGKIEGLVEMEEAATEAEVLKKYVAIHFPHKLSPVIYDYLFHPALLKVLTRIVSPNIKCMQSMLFVKGAGKAGQSWHQDEYYIPTRDKSLVGAWIAINDATIENGCLWIIPGSNKPGFIMPRVQNTNEEFGDQDTIDVSTWPAEKRFAVELRRGSVVFFSGYTLHASLRNKTASDFRMALVLHYMSAESMLPWDHDGQLPPTEDLRDIVLVAGTDPYAHKGTQDINKPYLRPDILKIKKTV